MGTLEEVLRLLGQAHPEALEGTGTEMVVPVDPVEDLLFHLIPIMAVLMEVMENLLQVLEVPARELLLVNLEKLLENYMPEEGLEADIKTAPIYLLLAASAVEETVVGIRMDHSHILQKARLIPGLVEEAGDLCRYLQTVMSLAGLPAVLVSSV